MSSPPFSRRAFTIAAAAAAAAPARSDPPGAGPAAPKEDLGITTSNAAIHQEVIFRATPARVYRALTNEREFDKVVTLNGAMKSMALAARPAEISLEAGGAFALFGGFITGRQIELTPDTRIVQVWRSAGWPPHIYSIARFELSEHPVGTKLAFDHTGFPGDDAVGLATGWREHYWAPLAKVL